MKAASRCRQPGVHFCLRHRNPEWIRLGWVRDMSDRELKQNAPEQRFSAV
jgi:hypothetical protein